MKNFTFLGIVLLAGLLLVSNLFAVKDISKVDNSKVIKFSHSKHINDVGVACADCHTAVLTSTKETDSLLPTMATCYTCHDQATTKCDFCHTSSDSTTYQDLAQTPSQVFFSHQHHTGDLKLKCETCHQGLDKVDYSEQDPKALPKMELCTTCHGQIETNAKPAKVDIVAKTTPLDARLAIRI